MHPKTESGRLPAWIAVGGSPQSVVRAAHYEMPVIFAIIGGSPTAFAAFAQHYRRALEHFGKPELPIAWHSPGHVAETDEQAREEFFPAQAHNHAVIGRERGWPPLSREAFEQMAGPDGAYYVGSPETVAAKVAHGFRTLGAQRFQLKVSTGRLSHEAIMETIGLYGTEVVPLVKDMLSDS